MRQLHNTGMGVDFTIGYVKNDGLFMNGSFRVGVGLDVSASAGLTTANYYGPGTPTATDLKGISFYQSGSYGSLNINVFESINRNEETGKIQSNWIGGSVDVSIGKYSYGNTRISITTPSYYLFKY